MKNKKHDICINITIAGFLCVVVGGILLTGLKAYDRIIEAYQEHGTVGGVALSVVAIGVVVLVLGMMGAGIADTFKKSSN